MHSRGKDIYWKVKNAIRIGFSTPDFVPWCSHISISGRPLKCTGSWQWIYKLKTTRRCWAVTSPGLSNTGLLPIGSLAVLTNFSKVLFNTHHVIHPILLSCSHPWISVFSLSLHLSVQSYSQGRLQSTGSKPERKAAIHHVNLSTCLTGFNQILKWLVKSDSTDRKGQQKNKIIHNFCMFLQNYCVHQAGKYQWMEPTDELKQHWLTFMNLPELPLTQWIAQCFNKSSELTYASDVSTTHAWEAVSLWDLWNMRTMGPNIEMGHLNYFLSKRVIFFYFPWFLNV